jgi:predicted dehydrogenase
MKAMVAHPDVDLIAVVVCVPLHRQLVMAGDCGKQARVL